MRVLAVAERAPTTFRSVVGGFPLRIVQEGTQTDEMIVIQVLLLSTQRRQRARLGVCLPGAVAHPAEEPDHQALAWANRPSAISPSNSFTCDHRNVSPPTPDPPLHSWNRRSFVNRDWLPLRRRSRAETRRRGCSFVPDTLGIPSRQLDPRWSIGRGDGAAPA